MTSPTDKLRKILADTLRDFVSCQEDTRTIMDLIESDMSAANLAVVDLDTQQRGVCNYNGPCEYRTALPTTKEPT